MRIERLIFLYIFIVPINVLYAQADSAVINKRSTFQYFNSFFSGGLIGEGSNGTLSFSFSTIHGLRYNRLTVGLGMGYDSYPRWRTVPITASISADVVSIGHNSFYIQSNAGYSLVRAGEAVEGLPDFRSDGGVVINPMAGYRIKANKYRIYLSAGYKYQRVNYSYSPQYWYWDFMGTSQKITVKENINRITMQIGFGWK